MFITLEGVEGAGKSTLLQGLAARFEAGGKKIVTTREPGGSALGKDIRSMLLRTDSTVTPEAELFLFLADRAQHVAQIIRPALAAGQVVLCDRYIDSTLVYQGGGRGFPLCRLKELCDMATGGLWPDVTFLIDLDVQAGLERAGRRHAANATGDSEGRFEAESIHFHEQIRQGFLRLATEEARRIIVLDGTLPPHELLEQSWSALARRGLAG